MNSFDSRVVIVDQPDVVYTSKVICMSRRLKYCGCLYVLGALTAEIFRFGCSGHLHVVAKVWVRTLSERCITMLCKPGFRSPKSGFLRCSGLCSPSNQH